MANGEIYNYKELSQRLENLGHKFKSKSDSEVIIHAYEQWGINCFQKLKGMFAFAIWDKNQETLLIARDFCGEKPLFYALDNNSLTFASEFPALLKCKTVTRKLDDNALLQYLHYQMIFSPDTILKDIKKLQPGHFAVYKNGKLTITNYTASMVKFEDDKKFLNIKDCANELVNSLEKLIEPVMVSDVPVGLFLSGGLDSSLILALMAKKQTKPIHTFSIGFEEAGFNELSWARKVANYFGTNHHEKIVRMEIDDVLPDVIKHLGEPMADASAIPYYHLSKLAASFVKVVLGGDGADEIWGGYRRHTLRPFLPLLSKTAPVLDKILSLFPAKDGYYASSLIESLKLAQQLALAQKNRYMPWNPVFSKEELHCLISNELKRKMYNLSVDFDRYWQGNNKTKDKINKMLWIDQCTFLPEDILTKVDRMSMAHSLEVRAPLLYADIISLATTIPGRYKLFGFSGKKVLKTAAKQYLPSEIINRKKHGFNVPVDAWFRGKGYNFIKDILLNGNLISKSIVQKKTVDNLIVLHHKREANHGRKLWSLLTLEMSLSKL